MFRFSQLEVRLAPLLAGLLLLAACSPASGAQAGLNATQWELTAIGDQQVTDSQSGHGVTLRFEDGAISGSGGCNSYGGQYQADPAAGTLDISQVVSTLMACLDNGVMQTESDFLGALNQADRYEIVGSTLRIFAGDQTLVFRQIPFDN